MLPGQSGKIVATFISTSTSPAAGSGRSRPNASITAHTANSCISQPTHWKSAAPSAGTGRRRTASPCRAIDDDARAGCPCRRAPAPRPVRADRSPTVEQGDADEAEDDEARHGPVRDLRRQQHPGDEERDGEEVEQPVREAPSRAGSRSSPSRAAGADAGRRPARARRRGPGARRSRAARSRTRRRPDRTTGAARAAPGRSSAATRATAPAPRAG